MRASVIVCFFVIGLVGLTLRNSRSESRRQAASRAANSRQHSESKPTKSKGGKAQAAPAEPQPPAAPKPPAEVEPLKSEPALARRDPKPAESPKVLWTKEIRGEPRPSSQAARQNAIEAAAQAFGAYLADRYPGFKWAPDSKFLIDQEMVGNERQEEQQLADKEAPTMYTTMLTAELREPQLKAALQQERLTRAEARLWQAGRGLGGLLIILLAVIGYVRLDDWTKGYVSLPLKLTAAAIAISGPVVVWWLI